jgi:4-amino-4-deoxy-L-arabinose transferase-like glycosyltransferase
VRRRLLLVIILSTLAFFSGLGRAAISESDEAFYAEAGREMVESGDWLTPHFNYDVRFQKPILFYWVVASFYRIAGVSEAAARAGSALSGLGLALLTFAAGRRMYGPSTALIAAAIVATSFGYFAMAHLSLPDLPLTFFITLAVWFGFRAIDEPESAAPLLIAALAAALGVLTKGPLGVLVPAMVLIPCAWLEGRLRRFTLRRLAVPAALFAIVALPWYIAMTSVHGVAYLQGFLVGDNLERFATARFNDPRAPWYYVPVVAGGLLPWTPLAVLLVGPGWRWVRRRRTLTEPERRLVVWVLLPLAFFTLSIGKQARYILPILPPLALLIGRAIDVRVASAGPHRPRAVRIGAAAAGLILALVGLTLLRVRMLLALSTTTADITTAALVVLLLGSVVAVAAWLVRAASIVPVTAGITAVTLTLLQYAVFSTTRSEPVELAAALIARERQADEPIATYHALSRNLVFYTHIPHGGLHDPEQVRAFLGAASRVICVMPSSDADDFEREGLRIERLAEFRYFDAATMKARTVLFPDPARDLTTITIVTNGKSPAGGTARALRR